MTCTGRAEAPRRTGERLSSIIRDDDCIVKRMADASQMACHDAAAWSAQCSPSRRATPAQAAVCSLPAEWYAPKKGLYRRAELGPGPGGPRRPPSHKSAVVRAVGRAKSRAACCAEPPARAQASRRLKARCQRSRAQLNRLVPRCALARGCSAPRPRDLRAEGRQRRACVRSRWAGRHVAPAGRRCGRAVRAGHHPRTRKSMQAASVGDEPPAAPRRPLA
eukprot:scaffold40574_cov27-Tisochrysis_lutea.AAC.4